MFSQAIPKQRRGTFEFSINVSEEKNCLKESLPVKKIFRISFELQDSFKDNSFLHFANTSTIPGDFLIPPILMVTCSWLNKKHKKDPNVQ